MSQRTGDRSRYHRIRNKRRRMRIERRAAKAQFLAKKSS